jgi:subtilisin family serine protease
VRAFALRFGPRATAAAAAALAAVALCALAAQAEAREAAGPAASPAPRVERPAAGGRGSRTFAAGAVLLEFRHGVSPARERAIERSVHGSRVRSLAPSRDAVEPGVPLRMSVPGGRVRQAVARLRRDAAVRVAEPDWLQQASATPNDPEFPKQWGDSNTGQAVPVQNGSEVFEGFLPGTPGDDANVLKAWGVTTGNPEIVVGEVDVGVDYNHPDLAANIWSNPHGILGCLPGSHGFNVLESSGRGCESMDTEPEFNPGAEPQYYGGHGTHVAGIIGAVGGNERGVAGINWHTTILPVKWLESAGEPGEVSNLIAGIETMVAASKAGVNIRVVNDSAVSAESAEPSHLLKEAIKNLAALKILFVTAAGNTGDNDDESSKTRYPCFYALPNELCVTASNNEDKLPEWANYGSEKVNLAAPGVSIYSTLEHGPGGAQYGYLSGGSMAAAQVSGAAALILSSAPSMNAEQLRADILEHVTKVPGLPVSSGGILNVCAAIPLCLNPPSPPPPTTTSTTSSAPPPPPPPPVEVQVPVVTASSTTLTATKRGTIRLALHCAATAPRCSGTVTLRLPGIHVTRRVHGHTVHSTITVTIASASFSIARGATQTLTLHLSARARALLAHHRTLRLRTTAVSHGTNGSAHTTSVTLTIRPPKHG